MTTGEHHAVEIVRDFDTPRADVFDMWIDPQKVAKWWGPERSVTVLCEIDPKPGGAMRIDERLPDGSMHHMTGTFEKVVAPELLVFRSSAPAFGDWPPWEVLNTVTFEELGSGRTRVKVAVKVVKFVQEKTEALEQGFRLGWAESFDKFQRALI